MRGGQWLMWWGLLCLLACIIIARGACDARPVQVVVSRYAEDVAWVACLGFRDVVVYDKNDRGDTSAGNPPPGAAVRKLPNVGREGHTYLYHIVTHYDSLADVTLFLPGSGRAVPDKWGKVQWVASVTARTGDSAFPTSGPMGKQGNMMLEQHGAFQLDSWTSGHSANQRDNSESDLLPCPERPLSAWYAHNRLPPSPHTCYHGVFAVSREHIQRRPRSFYARLLAYLCHHSNPEAGHYLERCWAAVFAPLPPHCLSEPKLNWGPESESCARNAKKP